MGAGIDINAARMARSRPSIAAIGLAFFYLVAIDVVLKFKGFGRICKYVQGRRTSGAPWSEEQVVRTLAAVDHAASLYFRRIFCLHRSIVLVCMLRHFEIPAVLVMGVMVKPIS